MGKYDDYDARLLVAIQNGCDNSMDLAKNNDLRVLAEPHRTETRWGKTEYYRIADRRLQALRKSGQIAFESKRWYVVKYEV